MSGIDSQFVSDRGAPGGESSRDKDEYIEPLRELAETDLRTAKYAERLLEEIDE